MSNFVLTYGDTSLRKSDVDLLEPGRWLNDTIINFYFDYLNNCINHDGILFISASTVFLSRFYSATEDLAIILQALKLKQRDLCLIPINNKEDTEELLGGSHWSLLVFIKEKNEFWHYDSLNNSNLQHAKATAAKFAPLFGITKSTVIPQNTPQQSNSYDCGVYLLAFAEFVANTYTTKESRSISEVITPNFVSQKRKYLVNLIDQLKHQ